MKRPRAFEKRTRNTAQHSGQPQEPGKRSPALTSKRIAGEILRAMSESSNRVRERRESRGLSQIALAERTALTRQSIGAIEAGRATPSVDVALRIAAALDCLVEDLFGEIRTSEVITADSHHAPVRGRSALARVAGRWVCYPLEDTEASTSADAIVIEEKPAKKGRVQVSPLRAVPELEENIVVMGCALGLGLLTNRLNSRSGAGRFLWLSKSSTASLEALVDQHTHVAGVHLADPRTGEANVPDVRRLVPKEPMTLVTFGRWQAGLVVRRGSAGPVHRLSDLARPGVRIVGREPGAGAQRLLEREARGQGLPVSVARKPLVQVKTPMDVGRAVALGAADVGPATQDVALALDLDFIPIAEERFDLVLTPAALTDARLQRMLDVLASAEFRRELSELGYDMRCAGDRVAEVNVA